MNPPSLHAWHSPFAVALFVCAGVCIAAEPPKLPLPPTDIQLGLVGGSRTEVLQRCKRLGIAPVNNPPLVGGAPDAAGRIEAASSSLLREAGFEVVGAAAYNKAFDSFNRAVALKLA